MKDVTRVAPEHDLEVINFSTVDFYKAIIQCIGHYYNEVAEAAAKKDDKFRSCLARLKAQFDNDYEMDTYLLDHLIDAIGRMNYKNPMDRLIFIHCREPKIMITGLTIPAVKRILNSKLEAGSEPLCKI